MLKFKMSLLLQNAKFKAVLASLMIASIVLGIIYIPQNKAAQVNANATNYSLTSTDIIKKSTQLVGKKYFGGTSSGKSGKGYSESLWEESSKYDPNKLLTADQIGAEPKTLFNQGIDCSGLLYWTLASLMKDKGLSGTTGFKVNKPVPVDTFNWIQDAKGNYITKSSQITFNGQGINILKADAEITKDLRYYQYVDSNGQTVDLPAGTLIISEGSKKIDEKGKKVDSGFQNHAWIYLGDFGTSNAKELQTILKKQYGVDVSANYIISNGTNTHWRIEASAKSGVVINNTDPELGYEEAGKTVGNIWAYQLASVPTPEPPTGKYTVELVKVKEDGTTVITSSEATFNINGESKTTSKGVLSIAKDTEIKSEEDKATYTIQEEKAPEGYEKYTGTLTLNVGFKLDEKNNKYVIDGSKTRVTAPGLNGRIFEISKDLTKITIYIPNTEKEEPPTGKYTVELVKVKEDGTTVITSSEATFNVNGESKTTSKGILNIIKEQEIKNEKDTATYTIKEEKAPEGYTLFDGEVTLNVGFKLDEANKAYLIDSSKTNIKVNTKTNKETENVSKENEKEENTYGVKYTVSKNGTKITVYVQNKEDIKEEPKPGFYNIELYKVDENNNIIKEKVDFSINGETKSTSEGLLKVVTNKKVESETEVDIYTIKETNAPEIYKMFNGTISLKVKMDKKDNGFELTEKGITFNVDGDNTAASFKLEGSTIKVYVKNTKKIYDLALRKYISKINGKEVEPSRAPVIDEESIKVLEQEGTALYHHNKNSLQVGLGDEVEYTIRVYNEGEILGYAKEITDYLPAGLTFVKLSEDNSPEYTTKTEAGSKVVVMNYNGNTELKSLRDFIGKSEFEVNKDYYQEVKLICKVEESNVQYITSRAEITNYGYNTKNEKGETVWNEAKVANVDIDSVENTIKNKLDLDNWYVNAKTYTYKNKDGKDVNVKDYYPGTQDDDDFETVEVITGSYSIVIKKVDSSNKNQGLSGAYFSVNAGKKVEVGPTDKSGLVTAVNKQPIASVKDTATITIKETKAPEGYKPYNKEIKVSTAFKSVNGILVLDEQKTKLTNTDKQIEMKINESGTVITITIPNDKKDFDFSLRKFITEINGVKPETSREPQVDVSKLASGEATTAIYNHPKDALDVHTSDIVTYTIRVYNECEIDGYATQVIDDIPQGLVYLPEDKVNKEYKWVMYKEVKDDKVDLKDTVVYNKKTYVKTEKAEEADIIVTDYLSKENGEANLIKAFDGKNLDYKDVKASFKVVEPETSDRVIINYAQVAKQTDKNGNPVVDRDSTPNEWIDGEDDQDIEKIKVKYFDLSLLKFVSKAIVYEDGIKKVTETGHTGLENPEPVVKVDLKNTNIKNVTVKFEYTIRITNEGEIEGYAKEISDYIPQGLKFLPEDNKNWKEVDGKIVTDKLANTLLKPGESADVAVILTWINDENNMGLKTNIAEISKDYNEYGTPDVDSTPNNKVPGEDDIDEAPVILEIKTGMPKQYYGVFAGMLAIITAGAIVIKRKILE